MLINWFTVAAQIVNFLILVALLKHFLYGPIVAAMAAREGKIAAQLAAARQKRQEAEQEEAAVRRQVREIEDQRQEMLAAAGRQAEAQRQDLISQVRREVEQLRQKWLAALDLEKENFLQNLKQRLGQEVVAVTRRAWQDLAGLELEQQVTAVFLERLRQLAPEEQADIREGVKESGGELRVTTAFELPDDQRRQLAAQMQEQFGPGLALRFAASGELLAGVELLTSSRQLAWSLGNFLSTLEEDLSLALQGLQRGEAA